MVGGDTSIEEVLDVVLGSLILVDELLVVPDRTVDLSRTIHLGTPGTILDEGLVTIPTLSVLVLELRQVGNLAELHASIIADGEVAGTVLLTALRGDDDDTVSGTRAIEGRSSGTLQHGHVLNVVRVHVGDTTHGILMLLSQTSGALEGHTVDDVQRLVVTVDRADTTDNHRVSLTRVTRRGVDLHTCHLTCQGRGNVSHLTFGQLGIVDGLCRIAKRLLFTTDTERGDNHLVQNLVVRKHLDTHRTGGSHIDGLHAEIRDAQRGTTRRNGQLELTVAIGHCALASANNLYGGTHDGQSVFLRHYGTSDLRLGHRSHCSQQQSGQKHC